MIIALCLNIKEFKNDGILKKEILAKYSSTGWIIPFVEHLQQAGHVVKSGDKVYKELKNKEYSFKSVFIVQEHNDKFGIRLQKMRCNPTVVFGFESLIFGWEFYDKLSIYVRNFPNRVLFGGAYDLIDCKGPNDYFMTVPNYNKSDISEVRKWKERKFIVMVAANKYYDMPIRGTFNPLRIGIRILRKIKADNFSKIRKMSISGQLHDERLNAIKYFGEKGLLDLYGYNWGNKKILFKNKEREMRAAIDSCYKGSCDDKISCIRNYKYAICYENQIFPGYITEKIIDCFVAGVIPIYLGAPDIECYIPKETFIDRRAYNTYGELEQYLLNMTTEEALEKIKAGRNFISNYNADKSGGYCNADFAKFMADLVTGEIDDAKN